MIDLLIKCPTFATSTCDAVNSWLGEHYLFAWTLLALIIILWVIKVLIDTIPQLQKLKADVLIPWAKKRDHGRQVKSAIKADIEGRVNTAIMAFGSELPKGWISRMKVDWVEKETKEDFFNDGEMVLRVRPLNDQKKNLVRAGHAFLQKAFFPRAKNVVPPEHREASVLFTGRKIMQQQGQEIATLYEDLVLEPAVNKNRRVLPVMKRYIALDARGFFMGAFLREVHAVAIGARFDAVMRNKMREEANALLDHMEEFIKGLPHAPNALWSRQGPITNYAFLLVARPGNVQENNVYIFVNRARESLASGVDRLYVLGSKESQTFLEKVINAIKIQVPGYRIVERFDLSKDYRGNTGGLGALFVKWDGKGSV